jgi:hypothetical protein
VEDKLIFIYQVPTKFQTMQIPIKSYLIFSLNHIIIFIMCLCGWMDRCVMYRKRDRKINSRRNKANFLQNSLNLLNGSAKITT